MQRYDLVDTAGFGGPWREMALSEYGDWALYDEVGAELARLRADNAKLVADVQRMADATQRAELGGVGKTGGLLAKIEDLHMVSTGSYDAYGHDYNAWADKIRDRLTNWKMSNELPWFAYDEVIRLLGQIVLNEYAGYKKSMEEAQRAELGAVALVEVPKYRDADGRPACGVSPDEVCSMLAHGWCGHIRRFLRERTHKGTYAPPAICPVWKEVDRG